MVQQGTSATGKTHDNAGVVEVGGLRLPFLAPARPRRLGEAEYLFGPGDLTLLHPFGDTRFYRHGWNSWSPSGWRQLTDEPLRIYDSPERLLTADDARNDTPAAHSGSAVGALAAPDGRTLLLGALGLGAPRVGATTTTLWGTVEAMPGPMELHLDVRRGREAGTRGGDAEQGHEVLRPRAPVTPRPGLDRRPSPGHDGVRADAGWYLALGDEETVFRRYAGLLAERFGHGRNRAGRVWCSWYSYYEDISEELLASLTPQIASFPFDVIQVDDGWEKAVGDWEANDKFPSGMTGLARLITGAGLKAGLWIAPLIALPRSAFVREHPEWLIQSPSGGPLVAGYNWGGPYYALDTTRPEVQDHLRALFTRLTGDGFSYFKLDFLYAGALEGLRCADVHREQAYRDALTLIRQAVGPDTYLLGCGAPILPSAGLFDGMRVGPDVGAFWDNGARPRDPSGVGAKNSLVAALHRRWLSPLYETDPDVVYFRRRRSLLDDAQRQVVRDLATVLGFKSTSDPISWLDPGEQEELRTWLERDETVLQTGRFSYQVGDRVVDLGLFLDGYHPPASTTVP